MDKQAGRIVVGYDGSADSGLALDWAAGQAERSGRPLTVINVVDYLGQLPGTLPTVPLPQRIEQVVGHPAEQVAAEGVHRARKRADSIDITAVTHTARVAYSLIEHSRKAALLVVGTRGHGELIGALLGSVAFTVSGHARCPVVIVRGDATHPPGPDRPVVVGVDDSPGSDAAVRFAADTAAVAGAPLLIVTAYQTICSQVRTEGRGVRAAGRSLSEAARHGAEQAIEAAENAARHRRPRLDVTHRIVNGPVTSALTSASSGAGLLVVGARGGGGFSRLMLGSVSHGVIHGAPCPVAVVPLPATRSRR